MKKSIIVLLQIAATVLITGGTALAMSPKSAIDGSLVTQSSPLKVEKVEAKTPTKQSDPTPTAEQKLPEKPPIKATSPPAPVAQPTPVTPVPVPTPTAPTGNPTTWMNESGISQIYWQSINYIVSRESAWCPYNWQGEVGGCREFHGIPSDASGLGYGLCQSTPASKMAAAGADWQTNPVTQLKWCDMHAKSMHGDWSKAYLYWVEHHNW
jgi:hypothetical protein